jgi:hypothetical protein
LDYKSAYHWPHLHAALALQCAVTTSDLSEEPLALVSLCSTFRGSPCLFLFSEILESVTDLVNALVRCHAWDPATLVFPHADLIGTPKFAHDGEPLAHARTMSVDLVLDIFGLIDIFLDDIITVYPFFSMSHLQ